MTYPAGSTSSIRPDLSVPFDQLSADMAKEGFVAHRVLPIIDVNFAANTFPVLTAKSMLQTPDTRRGPRGNYNRGEGKWTTGTYVTHENGYEERVDENELHNYESYLDLEQVCRDRAMAIVLRSAEMRCAAAMFNTSVWNGAALTTNISVPWSTIATAVPVTDVKNAKKKVWDLTGVWPNAALISMVAWENLRRCAQVLEGIMAQGAGQRALVDDVTVELVAKALGLEELIVAGMAKDTANEGQDLSIASVYGDAYCSVFRKAKSKDFKEVCVGRTFHWNKDGSTPLGTVETYWQEDIRSNVVRVRHQTGEQIIYPQAAHLLTNITG